MSYLKLISDKVQSLAESLSKVLGIEITVVDNNLLRIAGTGDFYYRINENSPDNSLFAKVIRTGKPELNLYDTNNRTCMACSNYNTCIESKSMIYPIAINGNTQGVISFVSFNPEQDLLLLGKKEEYLNILKHFTESIEKEILSITMINKLNMGIAEINGIINSINKGIIIINKESRIIYVNYKAVKILGLNFHTNKVINKKIKDIIKNIKIENTNSNEIVGNWDLGSHVLKVLYKVDFIVLDKKNISTIISFDALEEIISIATTYKKDSKITFENIIGQSQIMKETIGKARIAAKSDSTILINGASGTGKEVFATAIHNESLRKDFPFVAINCATLPENLIESELFGYVKGAFTGAIASGKIGKFEQANNGTLFLDEIGDLPLNLQSKLLRVLQERKVDKIGSSSSTKINVRVISATHKNLLDKIKLQEFREDLFYRLNVIPIDLPKLKDRDEDVLICSEYFLKKLCKRMNKSRKVLSKEVEKIFLNYNWPGNIRELENVLEYSVNFTFDNKIKIDNLPTYFIERIYETEREDEIRIEAINLNDFNSLEEITKVYEKRILNKLINKYGDTLEGKRIISEKLDLSITTLYRKLNDYYYKNKDTQV